MIIRHAIVVAFASFTVPTAHSFFAESTLSTVDATACYFTEKHLHTSVTRWEHVESHPAGFGELAVDITRMRKAADALGCEPAEFELRVDVDLDTLGHERDNLHARWAASCGILAECEMDSMALIFARAA